MPDNWWIATGGINYLKGDHMDPTNPVRLPDSYIISFLRTIPQARLDYNKAYPDLLPGEKMRLDGLSADNPYLEFLQPNPQVEEQKFQSKWNKQGIYTTGPRGGSRRG